MGFRLCDLDATIIHHFAFFNNPSIFHYPYVRAGLSFSVPILNRLVIHRTRKIKIYQSPRPVLIDLRFFIWFSFIYSCRLAERLLPSTTPSFKPQTDFTIDASHELALFIWNVDKDLKMLSVPYFCDRYGSPECAIYAREENIYCVRQKRL